MTRSEAEREELFLLNQHNASQKLPASVCMCGGVCVGVCMCARAVGVHLQSNTNTSNIIKLNNVYTCVVLLKELIIFILILI